MLRRIYCWIFGHQDLWQIEPERVRLKCFYCGRLSKGWELSHEAHYHYRYGAAVDGSS